jgi:nickel superoxide dismutase
MGSPRSVIVPDDTRRGATKRSRGAVPLDERLLSGRRRRFKRGSFDSLEARLDTPKQRSTMFANRERAFQHQGDSMTIERTIFRFLQPRTTVRAHCDLPCGVYDPEQARIEAESCYRIVEKYAANEDVAYRTRAIVIKEERAELVKHHLDVLWHDYFKPEHLATVPNLHDLFWQATKQASKVKASTDLADAQKLLDLIDEVDAAWKATGGLGKTRVAGRPG